MQVTQLSTGINIFTIKARIDNRKNC